MINSGLSVHLTWNPLPGWQVPNAGRKKSVQATKVPLCVFLHVNAGPRRSETSGPSGTEIAGELLTSRTSRILRLFYKISFTTFYFIVLLLPGYTMPFWILELIWLWAVSIPHKLEHTHKPQAIDLAQGGHRDCSQEGFRGGENISCAVKAEPLSGGHGAPQPPLSLLRALTARNSSKAPKTPSRRHGSREFYTSHLIMSMTILRADNMPTDWRESVGGDTQQNPSIGEFADP